MQNKKQVSKGKWFRSLLTCLLIFLGTNGVFADYEMEGFDNIGIGYEGSTLIPYLPEGWNYSGNATGLFDVANDIYKTSRPAIRIEGSNDQFFLVTPALIGNFMFYMRNRTKNYQATATAYACSLVDGELVLGDQLGSQTLSKQTSPTWQYVTFSAAQSTRVALLLSNAIVDDFTYEPGEEGAVITPTLFATASLDFGTIQDATTKNIIVKSNVATSVTMALTGDGAEAFTLVDAPTSLVADNATSVNIKMEAAAAGIYQATLIVTAGKLVKTVALTGVWEEKQPDQQPENWKGENFDGYKEGDAMPMGWVADGWAIGEPFMLETPAVVTFNGGTLTTPVFEVTDGQALQFYFTKTAIGWGYGSRLIISYSADKEVWTEAASYDKTEDDGTKKVALPAAGSYYVRFVANDRTYLDDFQVADHAEAGIAGVRGRKEDDGSGAYNLQGQRVAQPAKGVYIQNGKKFVKK